MKRWLIWVLLVTLVLTGCHVAQPDNTTLPIDTTQTPTTDATLPATGSYLPDCEAVAHTGGAVRGYGVYGENMTVGFMGEDPVVFTSEEDTVTISRLQGEEGYIVASYTYQGAVEAIGCGLGVTDQKLVYYNKEDNSCVVLDERLQEQDRIKLPEEPTSAPWFTADLTEAYFVIGSELRCLDLQTGIPRLISQMGDKEIRIKGFLQGDTILWCGVTGSNGSTYDAFLSGENGIELQTKENLIHLETWGESFMVQQLDGSVTEVLFGNLDGKLQQFADGYLAPVVRVLPEANGFLTMATTEKGLALELLSLEDGKRIAALELPGMLDICDLQIDPAGQYIWFAGKTGTDDPYMLLRWEYAASDGADQQVRFRQRWTAESPDVEGLADCTLLAQQLGEKYGVKILLQGDVIVPEGYTFVQEYQVYAYQQALEALDYAMSLYPEDFFVNTAWISNNRTIHICLVRDIKTDAYGAPDTSKGLQYWIDGNAYMALVLGDDVQTKFHRQFCRVMDTYIRSYSVHLDFWKDQNPEGFVYDESYTEYLAHADSVYLQQENRAFIDAYSMTFDYEDRATVMAYAMLDGMQEYFESDTMQAKLNQLCLGIRQAYRWKKYEGTFHWEQYLKESLAYIEE